MTNEIVKLFDGMDVNAVEAFLKRDAKDYIKERKANEKQAAVDSVKSKIKENDFVIARYKDGEISGTVVALRDKSLTILTEDVTRTDKNGEEVPSRIVRGYDFITEIGEATESEIEEIA